MSNHVNSVDVASSAMIGAETATSPVIGGDKAAGSSPIGGATPLSSSVPSAAKPTKNVDLLNSSGMVDLKATKPYKREPLHRLVNVIAAEAVDKTDIVTNDFM